VAQASLLWEYDEDDVNDLATVYRSQNTLAIAPGSTNRETNYLGFDRRGDGITPNYTGDPMNTPPDVQNYPDLSSAVTTGETTVSGTLNSRINTSFKIELYSNTVGRNFRAGEKFLGSLVVTTDASGSASINFALPVIVPAGQFVTSTATQLDAELNPFDTSEFSAPIIVNPTRGDYNADGAVDAADYVLWRNALSQSIAPFAGADGSGNGLVDQADHDVWRANFGKSGPTAAATTLEVEPASHEGGTAATAAFLVAPEPVIDPSGRARFADAPPAFTPGRRSDFVRAGIQSTSAAQFAGSSTAAARDDALLAWLAAQYLNSHDKRPSVGAELSTDSVIVDRVMSDNDFSPTASLSRAFTELSLTAALNSH
jgi:hypothetical protein